MKIKNLPTNTMSTSVTEALRNKPKGVYLFTDTEGSYDSDDLFIVLWDACGDYGYCSYVGSSVRGGINTEDWEGYFLGELALSLDNSAPSV